jgi:transcriptional regulator with XRE-family HTH domain
MIKIPNKIKVYRRQQALTQKIVAQNIDVDVSLITRWENGNSLPSVINLFALCIILKTTPYELYEDIYITILKSLHRTLPYPN